MLKNWETEDGTLKEKYRETSPGHAEMKTVEWMGAADLGYDGEEINSRQELRK